MVAVRMYTLYLWSIILLSSERRSMLYSTMARRALVSMMIVVGDLFMCDLLWFLCWLN